MLQRTIPTLTWLCAGAFAAALAGRHGIERLLVAGGELALTADVLGRIDRSDFFFGLALAVFVAPFAWRPGTGRKVVAWAALALAVAAALLLPEQASDLERFGRRAWGPWGDQIAAGVEVAVMLAVATFALGTSLRRTHGPRAALAAAMVLLAVLAGALLPHAALTVAAPLLAVLTLTDRSPAADA